LNMAALSNSPNSKVGVTLHRYVVSGKSSSMGIAKRFSFVFLPLPRPTPRTPAIKDVNKKCSNLYIYIEQPVYVLGGFSFVEDSFRLAIVVDLKNLILIF
jgi:hypothetical protein